jgi:hypothetical protein
MGVMGRGVTVSLGVVAVGGGGAEDRSGAGVREGSPVGAGLPVPPPAQPVAISKSKADAT